MSNDKPSTTSRLLSKSVQPSAAPPQSRPDSQESADWVLLSSLKALLRTDGATPQTPSSTGTPSISNSAADGVPKGPVIKIPDGYNTDERRPTVGDIKDGKSNPNNKIGGNGSRSKELSEALAKATPQQLLIVSKLMASNAIGPGRLGTRLKAYRFASDDRLAQPWSLYASYNKWAPLGLNNTNFCGAGWCLTGQALTVGCSRVSNDLSCSLDAIPLTNPSTNVMGRLGSQITVKRIFGKWIIKRVELWPGDASMGTTRNMNLAHNPPCAIAFIERTPIQNSASQDPQSFLYQAGEQYVCGTSLYPSRYATTGSQSYGPQSMNFLSYISAAQLPRPYLDNGAGAAGVTTWNVPTDNAESGVAECTHRSPSVTTEIYSLYKKQHSLVGEVSETSVTTTAASATGVRTLAAHWSVPAPHLFEVPLEHTFTGRGLKVVYADAGTGSYSVASINQLRAKYWQSDTGTYFTTGSATAIPTQIDTTGCVDHAAYEFFVEYEDIDEEGLD